MRFTFFWTSAAMLPHASEVHAIAAIAHRQRRSSAGNATTRTRYMTTSAAIFVADDMNDVTGVGAPWYASGVHMWNGAADALKASPTTIIASPTASIALPPCPYAAILSKLSWPVSP